MSVNKEIRDGSGTRRSSSVADYVVLTRFNLPSQSIERIVRAKPGWLHDRVELFERYCIPSIQAQSDTDFHWIVYFDPESPGWLKDLIERHQTRGIYHPFFRSSVDRDELLFDIRTVVGVPRSDLITSNLDNDDAIAIDFIKRIRSAAPKGTRTAIYLPGGLIKCEDRLYSFRDPRNPFCSVRESWASPASCWCDWHNLLGKSMPAIEIEGPPGWLQVIHGRNVSNRISGVRVSPSPYQQWFSGLIDDVLAPDGREWAFDLLVSRPARHVREAGRRASKTAALKLLGKEGLTRAKLIWASFRTRRS